MGLTRRSRRGVALVVAIMPRAGGPRPRRSHSNRRRNDGGTAATVNAPTNAVPDKPIELIALQYRSGPATAFEVSGSVRNPADGRALPRVVAVVNLVDADGRILASQTKPLERPTLEAGQTSSFSLAFPRVTGTVARYVVGFRSPGGDKVAHVDRRAAEPAAKAPSF